MYEDDRIRRFDKLSKKDREDLVFDLINAFALVKTPEESALLLHGLLTKSEIRNLSKRIRIAKMLLNDVRQEDIIKELHCSFGTIARVRAWLDQGAVGLKRVIKKLPKRTKKTKPMRTYPSPNLPLILAGALNEIKYGRQQRSVSDFLDSMEDKNLIDKQTKELISEHYKRLKNQR